MRFLTAGESHGPALVGILEGLPSNLPVTLEDLHGQLRRRKLGFGRGARQAIEDDQVQILAGVRHGLTLASPVAVVLHNKDWANWRGVMDPAPPTQPADVTATLAAGHRPRVDVPRPGHADRIGGHKYGHADMRNVLERSSARETAMRVALGAIARKLLTELDITLASRVLRIGAAVDALSPTTPVTQWNALADASPTRCLDAAASQDMVAEVTRARDAGDTVGGIFEVVAAGLPKGLGSYVHWDRRLEAALGAAFLSLNAIKGVEVGLGFAVGHTSGRNAHDALVPDGRGGAVAASNRSGGLEGGMSTGAPLVVRCAMKPLSTLKNPIDSVHLRSGAPALAHVERSDICAVPAAAVVGEALMALVLAEALLGTLAGDSMASLQDSLARIR